jgi:23S rRNA (cytidine1920-2'-O)/16S rRNA (cytidine1409-2'-O)-methyltransferase
LDQYLVLHNLAGSRAQAQALILAGRVLVDGVVVTKAGALVPPEAAITLKEAAPFVSRGGEKLAPALDHFGVEVQGAICLDAGAATGGFTDVLLQRGAARVYAVDVGWGQLDPRLRHDPRVVVRERTNLRHLTPAEVPEPLDLITLDLSFISLTLVLPVVVRFLKPGGVILALVKPQFEVGKGQVGKGGVVRDPALQRQAVEKVAACARELGLEVRPAFPAPLKGPKGNQEYFLHLTRPKPEAPPPVFVDKPDF